MLTSICAYLPEVDGGAPAAGAAAFLAKVGDAAPLFTHRGRQIEAVERDAYARGYEAGEALAQQNAVAQRAVDAAAAANALVQARERWSREEAGNLATLVSAAACEIETAIADAAARIMRPFIAEHAKREAVTELVSEVGALLRDKGGARVDISGPADLLGPLERAMQASPGIAARFVPAPTCDITVALDGALIETRLSAWLVTVAEGNDEF